MDGGIYTPPGSFVFGPAMSWQGSFPPSPALSRQGSVLGVIPLDQGELDKLKKEWQDTLDKLQQLDDATTELHDLNHNKNDKGNGKREGPKMKKANKELLTKLREKYGKDAEKANNVLHLYEQELKVGLEDVWEKVPGKQKLDLLEGSTGIRVDPLLNLAAKPHGTKQGLWNEVITSTLLLEGKVFEATDEEGTPLDRAISKKRFRVPIAVHRALPAARKKSEDLLDFLNVPDAVDTTILCDDQDMQDALESALKAATRSIEPDALLNLLKYQGNMPTALLRVLVRDEEFEIHDSEDHSTTWPRRRIEHFIGMDPIAFTRTKADEDANPLDAAEWKKEADSKYCYIPWALAKFFGWRSLRTVEVKALKVRNALCFVTVRALVQSPNPDALDTLVARFLVAEAWRRTFPLFFLDVVAGGIGLIILFLECGRFRAGSAARLPAVVWLGLAALRGVVGEFAPSVAGAFADLQQKKVGRGRCCCRCVWNHATLGNGLDAVRLLVSVRGLYLLAFGCDDGRQCEQWVDRGNVGLWALWQCYHVLWSLRGIRMFGCHMVPIFYAIWSTQGFIYVMVVVIVGISWFYYMLALGDDNFRDAMSKTFRLAFLGDFDLWELEDLEPYWLIAGDNVILPQDPDPSQYHDIVRVGFFAVSIVVTVTLMNLFIGVLSNAYDVVEDQSETLLIQSRAQLVLEYQSLLRPFRCLNWLRLPTLIPQPEEGKEEYVWAVMPANETEVEERSLRTFVRNHMKEEFEALKQDLKQDLQEIKAFIHNQPKRGFGL